MAAMRQVPEQCPGVCFSAPHAPCAARTDDCAVALLCKMLYFNDADLAECVAN